jgi:hypothetical protein
MSNENVSEGVGRPLSKEEQAHKEAAQQEAGMLRTHMGVEAYTGKKSDGRYPGRGDYENAHEDLEEMKALLKDPASKEWFNRIARMVARGKYTAQLIRNYYTDNSNLERAYADANTIGEYIERIEHLEDLLDNAENLQVLEERAYVHDNPEHDKEMASSEELEAMDKRQDELLEKHRLAIIAAVEAEKKDGKYWLDLGTVNEELGAFFSSVRAKKDSISMLQWDLAWGGLYRLGGYFDGNGLTFSDGLFQWSKIAPRTVEETSK